MTDPRAVEARIAEVLREHVWDSYFCSCGVNVGKMFYHADHVAEVVAGALAPDIEAMAWAIRERWIEYHNTATACKWTDEWVAESWRVMARAAVAAMGFTTEELK